MASSVYVGYLLGAGHSALAFGIAAGVGVLGAIWLFHGTTNEGGSRDLTHAHLTPSSLEEIGLNP